MEKSFKYYLVKVNRISGWCLLALVPVLLITGYGITGDYAWAAVIASAQVHSVIHKFFIPWVIGVFLIHSAINIHFALKRWRKR